MRFESPPLFAKWIEAQLNELKADYTHWDFIYRKVRKVEGKPQDNRDGFIKEFTFIFGERTTIFVDRLIDALNAGHMKKEKGSTEAVVRQGLGRHDTHRSEKSAFEWKDPAESTKHHPIARSRDVFDNTPINDEQDASKFSGERFGQWRNTACDDIMEDDYEENRVIKPLEVANADIHEKSREIVEVVENGTKGWPNREVGNALMKAYPVKESIFKRKDPINLGIQQPVTRMAAAGTGAIKFTGPSFGQYRYTPLLRGHRGKKTERIVVQNPEEQGDQPPQAPLQPPQASLPAPQAPLQPAATEAKKVWPVITLD